MLFRLGPSAGRDGDGVIQRDTPGHPLDPTKRRTLRWPSNLAETISQLLLAPPSPLPHLLHPLGKHFRRLHEAPSDNPAPIMDDFFRQRYTPMA